MGITCGAAAAGVCFRSRRGEGALVEEAAVLWARSPALLPPHGGSALLLSHGHQGSALPDSRSP